MPLVLYHWRSAALKNYAHGHIMIVASSIERARQEAREHFTEYAKEHWSFYDPEDLEAKLREFDADIAKDPVIGNATVFIHGSE